MSVFEYILTLPWWAYLEVGITLSLLALCVVGFKAEKYKGGKIAASLTAALIFIAAIFIWITSVPSIPQTEANALQTVLNTKLVAARRAEYFNWCHSKRDIPDDKLLNNDPDNLGIYSLRSTGTCYSPPKDGVYLIDPNLPTGGDKEEFFSPGYKENLQ